MPTKQEIVIFVVALVILLLTGVYGWATWH